MASMDWKLLIAELCAAGMTQTEIGERVGLSQSSVSDLVRGITRTVGWDTGNKLVRLHKRLVGKVA